MLYSTWGFLETTSKLSAVFVSQHAPFCCIFSHSTSGSALIMHIEHMYWLHSNFNSFERFIINIRMHLCTDKYVSILVDRSSDWKQICSKGTMNSEYMSY